MSEEDAKAIIDRAYEDFEQRRDSRGDYPEGGPEWQLYCHTWGQLMAAAIANGTAIL